MIMNQPTIHILLSTYNGGEYLEMQLESLLKQTYNNWELVIRDDGSTDKTLEIIEQYSKEDRRISILKDLLGNLRSSQSFSTLMEYVQPFANYVMFCDQDDIWAPEKIEISYDAMCKAELEQGTNNSLLVYSTYQLIDRDSNPLNVKSPSFPRLLSMNLLLAENYVYGCTTMINASLLKNATPISVNAENHDYWVALVAVATNGKITYINKSLLFYRQHNNNVSGSYKNAFFLNRVKRILNFEHTSIIENRIIMLSDLYLKFIDSFSQYDHKLIHDYIFNFKKGGFNAVLFCIRNHIQKLKTSQTIIYYISIFKGGSYKTPPIK